MIDIDPKVLSLFEDLSIYNWRIIISLLLFDRGLCELRALQCIVGNRILYVLSCFIHFF